MQNTKENTYEIGCGMFPLEQACTMTVQADAWKFYEEEHVFQIEYPSTKEGIYSCEEKCTLMGPTNNNVFDVPAQKVRGYSKESFRVSVQLLFTASAAEGQMRIPC